MNALGLVFWAAFAALSYHVGKGKNRATLGLVLGLLLGLIGLLIIFFWRPRPDPAPVPYWQAPQGYGTPQAYGTAQTPFYATPTRQAPGVLQTVGAQWAPDPAGRHQHRWWSGTAWTESVSDNGVSSTDPL